MADPVVFVPGLACTGELFAAQIDAISDSRRSIVADHTRHAGIPGIAAHTLAGAPPRFALVGLSMGGYVAMEIMRQAPERVSALVLMDTTARPDTAEATARRHRLVAIAASGRLSDLPALMMPSLVAPHRVDDPALVAVVARMMDETGPDIFARQQQAIIDRPDSRPSLARIRCPALVVVGDADAIAPPEVADEMAAAIPGARLETVPSCGHLSTLEHPETTARLIADFLGTCPE